MKTIADLHLHTVASDHAYSTIYENCLAAGQNGLEAIAITDHGPAMPDGAHEWHFSSLRALPRVINGVYLLRGVELNILDADGSVDLTAAQLKTLDFALASMHECCYTPCTDAARNTRAWLGVVKNPLVDCLGHMGNPLYPCDYEKIVEACAENGKAVEINSQSFHVREGSYGNCRRIAEFCIRHGVNMAVNSDGHFMSYVGAVKPAVEMLESLGCPEELVINSSMERLRGFLLKRRGLDISLDGREKTFSIPPSGRI